MRLPPVIDFVEVARGIEALGRDHSNTVGPRNRGKVVLSAVTDGTRKHPTAFQFPLLIKRRTTAPPRRKCARRD
jgi:hypothetical protein